MQRVTLVSSVMALLVALFFAQPGAKLGNIMALRTQEVVSTAYLLPSLGYLFLFLFDLRE